MKLLKWGSRSTAREDVRCVGMCQMGESFMKHIFEAITHGEVFYYQQFFSSIFCC